MKTITPELVRFSLIAILLAILFRISLSYGIDSQSTGIIISSAVLYASAMFVSGWIFGRRDREYLPIYDVGFRFHLTTYLVHNLVSELWFVMSLNSRYESIDIIHLTAIIWGGFLLLHFAYYLWAKRNSIDNLDKEDLFD